MSMDWKDQDRRPKGDQSTERRKVSATMVAWIVIAIIAVIFILQNTKRAGVTFLFWDGTVSVWVVIVLAMIIGAVLDRLATWAIRRRRAHRA
jgi:uncharacterized integral membrane protein